MDRRLVGFIAIILVTTSMITGLIYNAGEEWPVQILASRTPDNVPAGRPSSPSYSIDVLAVKELPDLVLRFSFLVNLTTIQLVRTWNETLGRGFQDLVSNVPRIGALIEHLDGLSADYNLEAYQTYDVGIPNMKILVIDFSEIITALAGESVLKEMYTVYAFGVGPGDRVSVMAGYRDFFVYPWDFALTGHSMLSEIRYSSPDGSRCFRSPEASGAAEGCDSLERAPVGALWFRDMDAEESVHVEVVLNTVRMFGHSGILQVIMTDTGYGAGPIVTKLIGSKAS